MRKLVNFMCIGLVAGSTAFFASCSEDDETSAPVLTLSQTAVTASPGEQVSIDIDGSAQGGFKSLVVTKLWDGAEEGILEEYEEMPDAPFVYTVTEEDAEHIVTLNFALTDNENRTTEKEVVITVELTPLQILLKYNWRLSDEIRKKTNESDITDAYNDDVYRFNADGTYNKSVGEKNDGFGDLVTGYCYYDLNENTMRLLMSRRDTWNNVDIVDTLDIVVLDETKLHADVTYRGLNVFDPNYDEVEEYEKRFVAVPKTDSFDPYSPGAEDDQTADASCTELEFEND